ncbi:MAG: molybdenum cofactor biosynthesis protein MoaE [Flammeovirgaceae bacterium]
MKKPKNVFIDGPITAEFIGNSIAKHQSKTAIGGHNIFLGQVRADEKEGQTVQAIEFSAYQEMAEKELHHIREAAFEQFDLTCMHIYHSLGRVELGEVCFFVFTSSPHREACFEATRYLVEEVKAKVPIFGKELFEDGSFRWKKNRLAEEENN